MQLLLTILLSNLLNKLTHNKSKNTYYLINNK